MKIIYCHGQIFLAYTCPCCRAYFSNYREIARHQRHKRRLEAEIKGQLQGAWGRKKFLDEISLAYGKKARGEL
jgi:hypothetical protein